MSDPNDTTAAGLAPGQILELTTDKLAFGGDAVARHDGLAVFVPYAAPGDRLKVEITAVEKTFARGRIVELLAPGPGRVAPRCRHYGDCGGCQFQHVDYATQLAAKREFVRDALVRIGRFDWTADVVMHHADPWRYRGRTQLKLTATSGLRTDGKHGRLRKRERQTKSGTPDAAVAAPAAPRAAGDEPPVLGFHRAFTHSVVDVHECPVLAPALERGLGDVRRSLAKLPRSDWPYQIEGAAGEDGASWAPDLPDLKKDLVEHEVLGFRFLVEPESFFQSNRHLVDTLVQRALGDEGGELAFDLYAGVGLFSLPLSKRFDRVVAVEDERRAATLGRVNARTNGCDNVTYVRRTTEQFLQQNRERPDLVLLDPPRLGAKPAIPALLRLLPLRIVYVACDPQTLARDLRTLADGGYVLDGIEAFDMFPQTYHVEAVARLSRSPA